MTTHKRATSALPFPTLLCRTSLCAVRQRGNYVISPPPHRRAGQLLVLHREPLGEGSAVPPPTSPPPDCRGTNKDEKAVSNTPRAKGDRLNRFFAARLLRNPSSPTHEQKPPPFLCSTTSHGVPETSNSRERERELMAQSFSLLLCRFKPARLPQSAGRVVPHHKRICFSVWH